MEDIPIYIIDVSVFTVPVSCATLQSTVAYVAGLVYLYKV